jgi:hypothetical protein
MYLSGNTRLIFYDPPGSPNCPPALQAEGCWNTGLLEGCGDPRQFATRVDLEAYAASRGETLRQTATAAEGLALCRGWSPAAPASGGGGATFTQTAAPGYGGTGFTASGRQILPTGVQTPSAPIVNITSTGPVADFGLTPPPAPAEPATQRAGMETGTMIIIGLAILGLMRRR